MTTLLPSFVTLSAFILPAAVLLYRQRSRAPTVWVSALLTAVFCMFGGLLFAAALITLFQGRTPDLLNSLMVLVGALLCLAAQQWYQQRQKR